MPWQRLRPPTNRTAPMAEPLLPEPTLDKEALSRAYDADVDRRNAMVPAAWRTDIIDDLLARLGEGAHVLELGCGTGQLAAYAQAKGFDVTAIDLSPGNVAATAARGIEAHVADFGSLPFASGSFDAAFAMQSFIHVPTGDLPGVHAEARRVLKADGYLTTITWGGERHEGPLDDEWLDPPRYFNFFPDDEFLRVERPGFDVIDLAIVNATEHDDLRAQVLTLRAVSTE